MNQLNDCNPSACAAISGVRVSTLTCAGLVVLAFLMSSPVARAALVSAQADPFYGQDKGIKLQADLDGSLVPLPGVGPGGITLYARSFNINNFSAPTTTGSNPPGIVNNYAADFAVDFLDAAGNSVGESLSFSGNLEAQFAGRDSNTQTGTFDMTILSAAFDGTYLGGEIMHVELLLPSPVTSVTIADSAFGNFRIDYNNAPVPKITRYKVNDGDFVQLELIDANAVPTPATSLLLAPALLAFIGIRRRRAALAA